MYGMFAVRVIEDLAGVAPVDVPPARPNVLAGPLPQGHTAFSWGCGDGVAACDAAAQRVPQGHTVFSWEAPWGNSSEVAETVPESDVSEALGEIVDLLSLVEEGQREFEFYSGNPRVQISRGCVHLYTRRLENDRGNLGAGHFVSSFNPEFQLSDEFQLFVLAIPSYLSLAEFCAFLGPDLLPSVIHMRVVRDEDPSRYMALLKLRDVESAEALRHQKNGARYSSFGSVSVEGCFGGASLVGGQTEAEATCVVLYVAQLLWESGGQDSEGELAGASLSGGGGGTMSSPHRINSIGGGIPASTSPPPPEGHVEVPRYVLRQPTNKLLCHLCAR